MRRTCLKAAVPASLVRLSVELQTPGLPEGHEEGRLAFPSSLSPPALPSLSVRPFLSSSPRLCSLPKLGENSCCTACTQASYLSSPTYPINHGALWIAACMDASVQQRQTRSSVWVNNFEKRNPHVFIARGDCISFQSGSKRQILYSEIDLN